ncbi:MAG: hypothetical protein ACREQI_16245 [Candidatus Binataceae bacterium]
MDPENGNPLPINRVWVATVAAWIIASIAIVIRPGAEAIATLADLSAAAGLLGAVGFGLTFWAKARVQIGRQGLRYKSVRRDAAIAAVIGLSLFGARYASQQVRIGLAGQGNGIPVARKDRVGIAVCRFDGDPGNRVQRQLSRTLTQLSADYYVEPVSLDRTIRISGQNETLGHLQALDYLQQSHSWVILWGAVSESGGKYFVRLNDTTASRRTSIDGATIPLDFTLPDLPIEDLDPVAGLLVATQAARISRYSAPAVTRLLEPRIGRVRKLADKKAAGPDWGPDSRASVNFELAAALDVLGWRTGRDEPLQIAVAYYLEAISEWPHESAPFKRAMAENGLAITLKTLGEGDTGTARLKAAVAIYRDALKQYPPDRDRIDWEDRQIGLGNALERLGERESGTKDFEAAVNTYQAAIDKTIRTSDSETWAWEQIDLGGALVQLSKRENDTKRLDEAITAFRNAIVVAAASKAPSLWGDAQNNLGQALDTAGAMEFKPEYFEQAAAAFRQALTVRPRENAPVNWAISEIGLGEALASIGEREVGDAHLKEGVEKLHLALEVLTPARNRVLWAEAQHQLGLALDDLGSHESDPKIYRAAIEADRAALTVYSVKANPQD